MRLTSSATTIILSALTPDSTLWDSSAAKLGPFSVDSLAYGSLQLEALQRHIRPLKMSMTVVVFLFLPNELICVILGYLGVADLLQCILVNKRLYKVVFESSSLQFTIELAKYRMKPPEGSVLEPPYATRLQILREREQRWRSMQPATRHKLRLAHSGAIYEFTGGIYGNGKENDRRSTISITLYDLPSLESGEQDDWTHSMDGMDIVDFTMDPCQDLLVLVALAPRHSNFIYDIHIRSMKTNEPHPLAAAPFFSCMKRPENVGWIDGAVRVQISGSLVGFLIKEVINSVGGHFEVYNWRTGGPANGCTVRHASGIDDFIFLSQTRFLLVRPNGVFEVYSFFDPGLRENVPTLESCYLFPALSEEYSYWYICLSSNPSPGYNPDAGDYGHNKIYYPNPDERIHACCIYVFQPILTSVHTVFSFVFFFRTRDFLNPPEDWTRSTDQYSPVNAYAVSFTPDNIICTDDRAESSTPGPPPSTSPTPPPFAGDPESEDSDLLSFPTAPPPQDTQSTLFHSPAPPIVRPVSPTLNPHVKGTVYRIPWQNWGPQNTRWFRECLSKDWQHSIYGLRTVECIVDKDAEDGTHNGPDGGIGDVEEDDNEEDEDLNGDSMILDRQDQGQGQASGSGPVLSGTQSTSARNPGSPDSGSGSGSVSVASLPSSPPRPPAPVLKHLRMRDFNPYSVALSLDHWKREISDKGGGEPPSSWHEYSEIDSDEMPNDKTSGKQPAVNVNEQQFSTRRLRRIITDPTILDAKGVFKGEIKSELGYVEVVTAEKEYDVTEVMMDDCRLLLLKRGRKGKLKSINLLRM
ncbi:hypothetical protein D9758_002862 [Tetrapyrgos nigripes]|uniref:F-box domain-containing protein n=1 Tax=Tetrapyrgos nigripes TaxID=182062 RepID=A0A8H5GPM4_9AGAR|nr:hypothetical protein D9758_002862 [Tetrapyrgos nigripes]